METDEEAYAARDRAREFARQAAPFIAADRARRDMFAAAAMQMMRWLPQSNPTDPEIVRCTARDCVALADALIQELDKQ